MALSVKQQNGDTTTRNDKTDYGTSEKKTSSSERFQETGPEPPRRSFLQRHAFMITLLLDTMLQGLGRSVGTQFRYRYFKSKYQDQLDAFNLTKVDECGEGVELDPQVQALENQISKETAQWGLYQDYASIVPLFIASMVIGMKSDQIGRRFLFILPFFSSLGFYGLMACVIRFNLHYGYTLIGSFISSCTGGSIGMYFAGYALVSDTHGKTSSDPPASSDDNDVLKQPVSPGQANTTVQAKEPEKPRTLEDEVDLDMSRERVRTYKIVGLDVLRRLSSSIMSFLTGYVIRDLGFFYTLVIVLASKVLLLAFAFFFVTETGVQKKSSGFMAPLRVIGHALKDPTRRTTLILVNLSLFLCIFGLVEEFEILHTYQMSPPFCLGPVQLGWLSSESRIKGLFSMPLMWMWRRLGMSEPTIAAVGAVSLAAGAIVLATIRSMWVFFAVPAIGIPGALSAAMAKTINSRLIGRSALASTFAMMLAGEEVFWFMGSITSNYLYQSFVSTLPTAPFYLATAAFAASALLFSAESCRQHRSSNNIASINDIETVVK